MRAKEGKEYKPYRQLSAEPPGYSSYDNYTDEEREYLKAVDNYRRRHGKRFLAATDYLAILKGGPNRYELCADGSHI